MVSSRIVKTYAEAVCLLGRYGMKIASDQISTRIYYSKIFTKFCLAENSMSTSDFQSVWWCNFVSNMDLSFGWRKKQTLMKLDKLASSEVSSQGSTMF